MSQVIEGVTFLRRRTFKRELLVIVLLTIVAVECIKKYRQHGDGKRPTLAHFTKNICLRVDHNSLRARHKSCFLRPDTGPCRADIIQYYFDAMQLNCYRFFWGGCQGNGNRFNDKKSCLNYCYINSTLPNARVPYFCNLSFDYGTCFGHYNRWAWDKFAKTCKRRLYSGCGGNQNNFETRNECMSTCLNPPNNTLSLLRKFTTCIPFTIKELH